MMLTSDGDIKAKDLSKGTFGIAIDTHLCHCGCYSRNETNDFCES